ncbi:MAG: HXXEE domain-containing protein [Anaerolineaceae bacterium]|nr:HXXEE domain-containing protein [Anaerolineaceae bacterium]
MTLSAYYAWLKRDWAKAGLLISLFLLIFLFVFVRELDKVVFVLLLQTPLYMLHQAEEYVFPGGFGAFFNRDIFKLNPDTGPVDENFIFFINIILIWIVLPFFGILSSFDYRLGLWLPYFSLFAGISHIILAIKAGKLYNPGLVISLFVNIPFGIWSIIFLLEKGLLQNFFLNPFILIGIALNALLPVLGVIILKKYKMKQSLV